MNTCAHEAYILVVESQGFHKGFFYQNNEGNIHISICCCLCCKLFQLLFLKRHPLHTHTSLSWFFETFKKPRWFGFYRKVTLTRQGTVDKFCISSLGSASIKSFYNPIALSEQHLVLFRSWLQIYICNCFMTTTTTFPIRCNENHGIVMQISGRFANKTNAITALKRNLLLLWEKVC